MCAYKELRGELKSDTHTTHTQETVLPQPLPALSGPFHTLGAERHAQADLETDLSVDTRQGGGAQKRSVCTRDLEEVKCCLGSRQI